MIGDNKLHGYQPVDAGQADEAVAACFPGVAVTDHIVQSDPSGVPLSGKQTKKSETLRLALNCSLHYCQREVENTIQ